MSYTESFGAAREGDLLRRLHVALVETAIAIQSEDPATANHAERSALAYQVLHNPGLYADRMALGVTVGQLTAASSDQDLAGRISAIWNAYALGG